MRGRHDRIRWAIPVAALATLALAGCGSSSGGGALQLGAIQAIHAAARSATSGQGFRMTMTMRMSASSLPSAITVTANGSIEPRSRTGEMTMDMDMSSIPGVSQALGTSTLQMRRSSTA